MLAARVAWPLLLLLLLSVTAVVASRSHRRHADGARTDNALQTLPLGGPNVCRSRHNHAQCCPGWELKPSTGLCIVPICLRPCGNGRCIRPNMCHCEGGTISPACHPLNSTDFRQHPSKSNSTGREDVCRPACINGGTCNDGKCTCKPGYTGSFCADFICRESCLNGGRCIGPDRCACVYGYTGKRCEADYRTGPCYTVVKNDMCLGQLEGIVCTKNLCCATIGKAWGHPCEQCPSVLDCDHGYLKNIHSQDCIDINECEAIPGLCSGGRCLNTDGSFTCECPEGQARGLTTNRCEDRDECLIPNICLDGRCVNTDPGYYCVCNPGYIPSQDRKACIDARQGYCYTTLTRTGSCQDRLNIRLSKKDCCCGMNMGRAWGDDCDLCPIVGEEEYRRLCSKSHVITGGVNGSLNINGSIILGPGGTDNEGNKPSKWKPGGPPSPDTYLIDECVLRPTICGGGRCVDTVDGYYCDCYPGYRLGPTDVCEDIDECIDLDFCQGGRCTNSAGSFLCVCPPGFDVSADGKKCIDHDECAQNGMCANGLCINMDGSFKCQCKTGYVLSSTGHSCIDIDECFENPRICLNGRCENIPGSHRCNCLPGFTPSPDGTFCVDTDECLEKGTCSNGKCINVDGSYKCVCDFGFRLSPDKHRCIDIDECFSNPCQHGNCTNTAGTFLCECSAGFTLGPDGRSCQDSRRDLCYSTYQNGQCSSPMSTPITKSSCCCSGSPLQLLGWGTPCKVCPIAGSWEYEALCPHGPGMSYGGSDINECAQNPGLCENGACENLVGSYRCICNTGFQLDSSGKKCMDINECEVEGQCGGGQCRNTPGSFQCVCPPGTKLNSNYGMCEDEDECVQLGKNACINGKCLNTLGSYECDCPPGTALDNTGRVCIDNRRGSCWTRLVGGRCENNLPRLALHSECCCSVGLAWGSPCEMCNLNECQCPRGYAKVDGKTCTDINECDLHPAICRGGGTCVNTEGSFTCICPPGLTLDTTGTLCIDRRLEPCFTDFKNGAGLHPIDGLFSKAICCCTSVGRAWGTAPCEACPRQGTNAHSDLCPRGPGFVDRKDINECTQFPGMCENGRCRNTLGGYSCRCNQGYALDENGIKCLDIDECNIMHGVCGDGICKNAPGTFFCDCKEGYENAMMMQVCVDINECERIPGLCRGGVCVNTPGSYKCECPTGHELAPNKDACKDIDECSRTSGICSHGVCENMMGTYQCVCDEGYQQTGLKSHCEDIDECIDFNGGCENICINTPGSYKCSCREGYKLTVDGKSCVDVDECEENTRICNGGDCSNTPGSYNCVCTEGLLTQPGSAGCIDVNECEINPNICGNGECENILGSYHCRCEDGYSMQPNQIGCLDIDECDLNIHNCDPQAHCINNPGSFQCVCLDGYTGNGEICRDVNECLTNNGGCNENAQCINTIGSYKCECDAGFKGDGYSCIDIDECTNDQNLCEHGHCLNYPGSFRCECEMGFMHPDDKTDQACLDINECEMFNNLCLNGRCENIFGMFRCECNEGYKPDGTGGNCTDIDECESPQACLYGSCINTEGSFKCQCPHHYQLVPSGNGCVDLRSSRCYLSVEEWSGRNRCLKEMGEPVTRATCCCSVGKAWGSRCELCPPVDSEEYKQLCPGGTGYRPNSVTVVLEDINECAEHENLCRNGHCTNTFGSFMCSCKDGYRLDDTNALCVDINECQESPDICGVGFCINDNGNYHCVCPDGYMLLPNGKECVDMRKEICYMHYSENECTHQMSHEQTKMLCCCSMGQAWGKPCKECPKPGTRDYVILCGTRPGQIMNPMTNQTEEIDECKLMPTMCQHGTCLNTPGSFECACNRGFMYDEDSHQCVDINECLQGNGPCRSNAQCINTPGHFECQCPDGYTLDSSMRGCIDIDECRERPGICQNGECNNFQGSFQCVCQPGYQLTPLRDTCIDVDECLRQPNTCSNNGSCINSIGSYTCHCYLGFKLGPNNDCIDIDECRAMPYLCRNGRCRNTIGSFHCDCAEGYVQTLDGMHCRDLDECSERHDICQQPGKCQNLMGYYTCICPPGYRSTSNSTVCVDIDECAESEDICEDGTCINTEGGVICECPEGFVHSADNLKCIDVRRDLCYDHFHKGECTQPRMTGVTVKECCCSMGKAWGRGCEQCPREGSDGFEKLCPSGAGRSDTGGDINECIFMPDACENGECINTDGSFRCECPTGFILDSSGKKCIDEDECQTKSNICGNGTCTNVRGSFECTCNKGYAPGPMQICEDVNECKETGIESQCAFRCHNVPGSFRCICPYGYALAPDGRHCLDVDECTTPANNCKYMCKNLIGSFMCICPEGYQQIGMSEECRDINECALNSGLCANGRCINTEGSYRCECYPGFEPFPDGKSCQDRREGHCYRQLVGGRCSSLNDNLLPVTRADCCCTMGTAWGPQCEICPIRGSPEYQELCLESGFSIDGHDIDECQTMRDLCKNGRCINTLGSYRCLCNKGYQPDSSGTRCRDVNECERIPSPCAFSCSNTEGSYTCSCGPGYILNPDGTTCRDIDECAIGQHVCSHNCINTQGSYKCDCPQGYTKKGDRCTDIDECQEVGVCPSPGRCINSLGNFTCVCPRGFRLDPTKRYCTDRDECSDDAKCQHGCQNLVGGYKCGCPEGYIPHIFYNQCLDENECASNPCGDAGCINTLGSYRCGCPNGFQYDNKAQVCIQMSSTCLDSPCLYGCIPSAAFGPICACPNGYRTIGQGHCVSTINQQLDVSNSNYQKYISTEGCFSCRTNNGRKRRSIRVINGKKIFGPPVHLPGGLKNFNNTLNPPNWLIRRAIEFEDKNVTRAIRPGWVSRGTKKPLKGRKMKRHFQNGEQLNLKVTLPQTKHRMRIVKLQPAVNKTFNYKIAKGNEQKQFEMVKKHGVWALHFRRRLKQPGSFDLEIDGEAVDKLENDTWERPLTLKVRLKVT